MKRSWPWFVAGIALAATITIFAVAAHNNNQIHNPVIHVRPGGT